MDKGILAGRLLVVPVALLLLEGVVWVGLLSDFFVARPSDFLYTLARDLLGGELLLAAGRTLASIGMAFVVCTAIGIPAGYVLWRFPPAQRAYEPILGGVLAAPTVLLYPVLLIFFGRTTGAILALTALTATVPIILNTRQGLADVNPTFIKFGRTLRLSRRQMFRYVLVPAALPIIFAGLRLAGIYILIVVVALEYIVGIGGLGFYISDMSFRFRTPELFAGISMVLLVSVVVMYALQRLQQTVR